jgi:hypothetical protein
MERLAEDIGIGEGLEVGACWWQLTVTRCAEERWRWGKQRAWQELGSAPEEEKGTLASLRGSTPG